MNTIPRKDALKLLILSATALALAPKIHYIKPTEPNKIGEFEKQKIPPEQTAIEIFFAENTIASYTMPLDASGLDISKVVEGLEYVDFPFSTPGFMEHTLKLLQETRIENQGMSVQKECANYFGSNIPEVSVDVVNNYQRAFGGPKARAVHDLRRNHHHVYLDSKLGAAEALVTITHELEHVVRGPGEIRSYLTELRDIIHISASYPELMVERFSPFYFAVRQITETFMASPLLNPDHPAGSALLYITEHRDLSNFNAIVESAQTIDGVVLDAIYREKTHINSGKIIVQEVDIFFEFIKQYMIERNFPDMKSVNLDLDRAYIDSVHGVENVTGINPLEIGQ